MLTLKFFHQCVRLVYGNLRSVLLPKLSDYALDLAGLFLLPRLYVRCLEFFCVP